MSTYVVERYLAGLTRDQLRSRAEEEARLGAANGVRFIRSIYLCEDELCFSVFEADSDTVLRDANREAGMAFERIVEALDLGVDDLELTSATPASLASNPAERGSR